MRVPGFIAQPIPLLIFLLWTPGATAQRLAPGQHIRVTALGSQPERIVGELVRLDQDSLVLERDGERLAVPRLLVVRTEAFDGRHGHTLGGAVIGGLSVGAFVGQDMLRKPSQCEGSGNYGQLCAIFALAAVAAGAGLGALIGTAIRHDDWIAVSLERAGFGPGHVLPQTGGPSTLGGWRLQKADAEPRGGPSAPPQFSVAIMLPLM